MLMHLIITFDDEGFVDAERLFENAADFDTDDITEAIHALSLVISERNDRLRTQLQEALNGSLQKQLQAALAPKSESEQKKLLDSIFGKPTETIN